MSRRFTLMLTLCLVAATGAQAQPGGGSGGGGGKHGGKHGGGSAPAGASASPLPPQAPADQVEIVGVIRAVDPTAQRLTIQYDAVEALDLPAGTMPFVVSKTPLMTDVKVGQKVRFRLESHQITALQPF